MRGSAARDHEVPDWVLAFGPFVLIGALLSAAFVALSTVEFDLLGASSTGGILLGLAVIGFVAGILPVAVGMLWFPYIRRLDREWIHAVLAFSGGLLAFIAVEMAGEALGLAMSVPRPLFGGTTVAGFAVATMGGMEAVSRWRRQKTATATGEGLRVAYLVAFGLGIHSVGEGLAIGSAFVIGESDLVLLLAVGFIMHNVTEGPAVISAVARDAEAPPLRHFAFLGVLAGGGVILGGWIGGFVDSALVAAVCFAVAFGAIAQVLWEMRGLVLEDVESLRDVRLGTAFLLGVAAMFFLEVVLMDGWLVG